MDWTDGPATIKQLRFLERHGFKPGHPLTKTEASDMIRRFGGQPEEFCGTASPHAPAATAAPPVGAAHTGQAPHGFGIAVLEAKSSLADADARSLTSRQQAVAAAVDRRQQFWLDTCRECAQMQFACHSVMELYQKHGCLFFTPTPAQVQEILDALDSAMPLWDRDRPDVFFQTLSLNFPQLLKHL
jgi:hypothetical protein